MKKTLRQFLVCLVCCGIAATLTACVDEDEFPDTPQGNFEALWKIIDEPTVSLTINSTNTDWTGNRFTPNTRHRSMET